MITEFYSDTSFVYFAFYNFHMDKKYETWWGHKLVSEILCASEIKPQSIKLTVAITVYMVQVCVKNVFQPMNSRKTIDTI
jgi:hypothetical protein